MSTPSNHWKPAVTKMLFLNTNPRTDKHQYISSVLRGWLLLFFTPWKLPWSSVSSLGFTTRWQRAESNPSTTSSNIFPPALGRGWIRQTELSEKINMEHLFQLLSKALSLWSWLWCIYKSFQEGLSDILLFHLYSPQIIPSCLGWAGREGSVTQGRISLEFLRSRTDGDHFHLPFPDTKIHIIREAATEQQERPGPNLPKATAKSLGPEKVAQAECVCHTLQKDHNPNGLLVWMQLYRGMGWGSPYAHTAPLIHEQV